MGDKLSVIFTSYNHKEYLRQAIDSLLSQSYANFELIIIDDCSTDGSQTILQEYQDNDRVRLILKDTNSGSYVKASNFGASFATGEFLLFAQCDDFAEPNQVENLMAAFTGPNIGVSFCRSTLVNDLGESLGDDFSIREDNFRKMCYQDTKILKNTMRSFLSKSCVIPNLSAAIIRRELFIKVGGLSEKYLVAADWAFWLSLSEECDFYYTAKTLNNFRQHNTTIRSTIKIKKQILEIYDIFYNHLIKYQLPKEEVQQFRVGAGAIWISYFSQGKKPWIVSFFSIAIETFRYDKLNIVYLALGLLHKMKEYVKRKIG